MSDLLKFQLIVHNVDTSPVGEVDCDGDLVVWFAAPDEDSLREWCSHHYPDLRFPPESLDMVPEFTTLDVQDDEVAGIDIVITNTDIDLLRGNKI